MKDLTTDTFVTLLKTLASKNPQYLIPTILFEAIIPDFCGNGLCLQGLGLRLFQQAGQGLFDVLQHILPTVIAPLAHTKHASSTTRMPTALTTQAHVYFMRLQQQKTSWFLVRIS